MIYFLMFLLGSFFSVALLLIMALSTDDWSKSA